MGLTNTTNQGFPLAQYSDSPTRIGSVTMPALAAAVDAKAGGLDTDSARLQSPNMVKISCTQGYLYANDPSLIGMLFDTVEVNKGTPTDLSTFNGLQLNRGLWMVGAEVSLNPVASLGNNRDVIQSVNVFTGPTDPFGPGGMIRFDLTTAIQTVGMPNLFTPVTFGFPRQYLNGCTFGLVPTDNFQVQMKGLIQVDVPHAILWAVQLGDL